MSYTVTTVDAFATGSTPDTGIWAIVGTTTSQSVSSGTLKIGTPNTTYRGIMGKTRDFNLATGILGIKLGKLNTLTSSCEVTFVVEDNNNGTPNSSRQVQVILQNTTWIFDQLGGASLSSKSGEGTGGGLSTWTEGDWVGFGNITGGVIYLYKSSDGQTWTEMGHATVSSFTSATAAMGVVVGHWNGAESPTYQAVIYEAAKFVLDPSKVMKVRVGGAWVTVVKAKVKVRVGGAWVAATPKVRVGGAWVNF